LPNVLITLQATGTGNTLSAPGMTNSSGVYQGTLSSTKAESKVITASAQLSGVTTQINGSANVTVAPAAPSASQSTLTADPLSIMAGTGSSTITVRVKDAFANDVPGATVTLSATGSGNTLSAPGVTNASGVYTGSLASTVAEQKVVSAQATVGGQTTALTQTATITVVAGGPGPVSPTQSTVAANPTTINQGSGTSTITVTVRDAGNTPIPGATVTLSATGSGNTLSAPGVTNGSGVYTGSLTSTVAEQKVVSAQATVGGQTTAVTQTATVTVVAVPGPVSPTQSTIAANPTTINQGTGTS
jgi:adhesin/invasin